MRGCSPAIASLVTYVRTCTYVQKSRQSGEAIVAIAIVVCNSEPERLHAQKFCHHLYFQLLFCTCLVYAKPNLLWVKCAKKNAFLFVPQTVRLNRASWQHATAAHSEWEWNKKVSVCQKCCFCQEPELGPNWPDVTHSVQATRRPPPQQL